MEFADFIKIPMVDNVTFVKRELSRVDGTLCVTGHHLMFSSRLRDSEELMLLHSNVESVERKVTGQGAILTIKCKNFDQFQLMFPSSEDAQKVAASVEPLSVVETLTAWFPYFYQPPVCDSNRENGWDLFSTERHFPELFHKSQLWRISSVNEDYKVCSSYPSVVIIPRSISDEELKKSAGFRQRGRFPVLCYFHAAKKSCLVRSSQPASGLMQKRCKEDERLLNAYLVPKAKGLIFDTRSTAFVYNSKSKGFGIESDSHYSQWQKTYGGLGRHKELTDTFHKYVDACMDPESSTSTWLSRLESSGWLKQVQLNINAAIIVGGALHSKGCSVLVHGGGGKDTTLVVSSLTQVLLDPQCRTVLGFEGLIVREWLAAGHPFRDRCIKLGTSNMRYRGQAPMFLLFLDSVYQVMQQYPCSFEFNDKLLQMLFENAYSSKYGTFLGNSECDRVTYRVQEKTTSLWTHLNNPDVLKPILNPVYLPNDAVLRPSPASQCLMVWSGIFLRGHVDPKIDEQVWDEVRNIQSTNKELKTKALELRREYVELQSKVRAKLKMDGKEDEAT